MDPISQTKCSFIYDTVITTPLGTETIKFFMDNSGNNSQNNETNDKTSNDNDSSFLLQLRDKLDENKYLTPQDFINETKSIFLRKARDLGSESDISLSLLTLLQLITDNFEKCFPSKDKQPLFEEFNSFIEGIDEFGKTIPNDRKAFIKFYNSANQADDIPNRPARPSKFQIVDQKTDVEDLYKRVMELKTDKDFERVVDIIVSHEPLYSHSDNIVEIDLYKCQPYTLKLIKNYVESQESEENNEENNKSDDDD